jgi:DNA-binding transcriptional LysR family regulator
MGKRALDLIGVGEAFIARLVPCMLTLRQIEVVRAIMVTGTVGGAARLLNVSSPGISRVMKHAEATLGLKLFHRKSGRFVPTQEANDIFSLINGVYEKVEDLQFVVRRLKLGADAELRAGSVPSIANVMVPRAVADVRRKFPSLLIDLDVLKLEVVDYLLLGKGELVAISYRLEHPMVTFAPLAEGRLKCVVPREHPLALLSIVSVHDIHRYPLIGIDPNDPYGRIVAGLFARHELPYEVSIRARFGTTVCGLVANGLGIGVLDEFTLADDQLPGLRVLDIQEPTLFQTYFAKRKDATLSVYGALFVAALRRQMEQLRRGPGKK